MNYLRNKVLIWMGSYFPFVPRLFGLKVLRFGYIDITPDLCTGSRPKGGVESKVSWLVENLWESPLPVKIVIYGALKKLTIGSAPYLFKELSRRCLENNSLL